MKKPTKETAICIHSGSKFYFPGVSYQVYVDEKGVKYTKGSDGLFDKVGATVSKFKVQTKKEIKDD